MIVLCSSRAFAQTPPPTVSGTILDPLGSPLHGATVTLLRDGKRVTDTRTDAQGRFTFSNVQEGRYELHARAEGFAPRAGEPFFLGASGNAITTPLTLQVGLEQDVVVSATAAEVPASQSGASVTVIDRSAMDTIGQPDVLEVLRLVPGVSVVQLGARGAGTSVFIRGGESDFNKVLVDGVPANDVGGAFDFSDVATTGIDRIEVLREANSVLYGSDALAGVISLTTRRGRTRIPELSVSFDRGNLGTHREEASIGGTARRFDYFLDFSRFRTDNQVADNAFDNKTFASRFGIQLGSNADVTFTIRHTNSEVGAPNAFNLFGVADNSSSAGDATYVGVSFESQVSSRWRATARFASMERGTHFRNPTPTGEAFDPFGFGANYLGKHLTIRGANGYAVTGQGILDYGGQYPTTSDANATRRAVYGHVTGRMTDRLDLSLGARAEQERGILVSSFRPDEPWMTERTNSGVFVEARATLRRVFASGGIGYDHHAVFKSAVTPRMSAAVYLRNPSATEAFGETKLTVNAGKGIKAPDVFQELSSLFTIVQAVPAATRPSVAGLSPIGPERNRSIDIGVEQALFGGRARARATVFHNQFSDLVEFVNSSVLPRLDIPSEVASAAGFGAYVNSSSYRARGVELSTEVNVGSLVTLMASYTHLDAVVDESFGSTALAPSSNPAFPTIPIGKYGPLKGAAPFRRPAHSGNFVAAFTKGALQIALAGYLAGKSDDSTFLDDAFFGDSLLLPNHNLNAGYQKIDLSGSYRIHPRLRWYANIDNLLDQDYSSAFGFPALPATIRTGVSVTLGGDTK